MPRIKTIDIDPAAVDPDGLADGVSSAVVQILLTGALTAGSDLDGLADGNTSAGASITLDGALTSGGVYHDITGVARHIHIADLGGDAQTGATYTITGLGSDGLSLVESIAGPAASGFVITSGRFGRVSSIAIASPAAGSTVDIGVNGVFTSSDGLAHRLDIIDTGADVQTTATYTITGTSESGITQTEDIAGPGSSATIETTKYFSTVTSITIASPVATSTIDVGTVDEVQIDVYPLNHYNQVGATIFSDVTGTIDFTVQETFNSLSVPDPTSTATFINITALAAKTADTVGSATVGASASRVTVNSYSTGAELQVRISQANNS
jgi:hypothetical protein